MDVNKATQPQCRNEPLTTDLHHEQQEIYADIYEFDVNTYIDINAIDLSNKSNSVSQNSTYIDLNVLQLPIHSTCEIPSNQPIVSSPSSITSEATNNQIGSNLRVREPRSYDLPLHKETSDPLEANSDDGINISNKLNTTNPCCKHCSCSVKCVLILCIVLSISSFGIGFVIRYLNSNGYFANKTPMDRIDNMYVNTTMDRKGDRYVEKYDNNSRHWNKVEQYKPDKYVSWMSASQLFHYTVLTSWNITKVKNIKTISDNNLFYDRLTLDNDHIWVNVESEKMSYKYDKDGELLASFCWNVSVTSVYELQFGYLYSDMNNNIGIFRKSRDVQVPRHSAVDIKIYKRLIYILAEENVFIYHDNLEWKNMIKLNRRYFSPDRLFVHVDIVYAFSFEYQCLDLFNNYGLHLNQYGTCFKDSEKMALSEKYFVVGVDVHGLILKNCLFNGTLEVVNIYTGAYNTLMFPEFDVIKDIIINPYNEQIWRLQLDNLVLYRNQ